MNLEEILARLAEIDSTRREIHLAAGDNALDEEQQTRWDALDTEESDLRAQETALRAELAEREARADRVAASRARWGSLQFGTRTPDASDAYDVRTLNHDDVISRSLATIDSREGGSHLSDRSKAHLERLLRIQNGDTDGELIGRLLLATERPEYRSAFQKISATTTPILTAEEGRAVEQVRAIQRAMSIGSDPAGGFAVPVLIDPTVLMTAQGEPNDILRLARVEVITNDEWKGLTSAGVTWQFHAEAAAATDNSPTIAQPTVTTRRADGFIPFSIEVGMDWPGFAENMSTMLGEGYDELLADKLTNGTQGSNEPNGLIAKLDATTSPANVEVTTAGLVGAVDVYGLWDKLPKRFRRAANCAWMSSTDVQNSIRQLGTVDPNFTVNITDEAIGRMFGREFPTNDYMQDDPAGTGVQPLLVVGDFRGYLVAQRAGMVVEFIPHLFDITNNKPTGQRGYFAWARVGADVIIANAFRLLVNRSA
jgi:HK97 family phage major capsid protein